MASYSFVDTVTGEEIEKEMPMGEREAFLQNNPHLEQIFLRPLHSISGSGIGDRNKPSADFRDLLKNIKRGSPRSTVNTY